MRPIFQGFCINRFDIAPLHHNSSSSDIGFEFAELFVIGNDSTTQRVGESPTGRVRESHTLWLGESGSRRFSDSASRGVANSQLVESGSRWLSNLASLGVADSPTRRVGESECRFWLLNWKLPVFRLRISPPHCHVPFRIAGTTLSIIFLVSDKSSFMIFQILWDGFGNWEKTTKRGPLCFLLVVMTFSHAPNSNGRAIPLKGRWQKLLYLYNYSLYSLWYTVLYVHFCTLRKNVPVLFTLLNNKYHGLLLSWKILFLSAYFLPYRHGRSAWEFFFFFVLQ